MTRRDPDDRWQQRVAWHELGHAFVAVHFGVKVREVVHTGSAGWTTVEPKDHQWREFAVGCLGGSAGEWLWEKHNNGWFGSRSYIHGDLELFRQATEGRKLSESAARSEARRILRRYRGRIEVLAPRLITVGRLSGGQL